PLRTAPLCSRRLGRCPGGTGTLCGEPCFQGTGNGQVLPLVAPAAPLPPCFALVEIAEAHRVGHLRPAGARPAGAVRRYRFIARSNGERSGEPEGGSLGVAEKSGSRWSVLNAPTLSSATGSTVGVWLL